jgi:hypothetical protein
MSSKFAKLRKPPANGITDVGLAFGDITRYLRDDGTVRPEWERDFIVRIALPAPIPFADGTPEDGPAVTRLAVHAFAAAAFEDVFARIHREGKWPLLTSCGGAFAVRLKRGSRRLSLHAWGLAVDLNVEDNPMGKPGKMPRELVSIFKEYGFSWGGNWPGKSRDPMHFQYANGY